MENFTEKNFVNYSLVPTKDVTPPNFTKKTFTDSHKALKFAKALSLESFLLYGIGYKSLGGGGGGGGGKGAMGHVPPQFTATGALFGCS